MYVDEKDYTTGRSEKSAEHAGGCGAGSPADTGQSFRFIPKEIKGRLAGGTEIQGFCVMHRRHPAGAGHQ
jgi:hypothetical protein